MGSTHRIYLFEDRHGRTMPAGRPTGFFYDIDAGCRLDAYGTRWYRVTGAAAFSRAWTVLHRNVPDGAEEGLTTTELGARMRLIQNCWYVDARNISLENAAPLAQKARLTLLQWAAFILVFGGLVGALVGTVKGGVASSCLVLAALILAADRWMQRRGSR